MRITNKSIVKMVVMLMVAMSLFTLLQAYYSAYLQLMLLVVCFFTCQQAQRKTALFIFGAGITFIIFMIMDSIKNVGSPMDNLGLFLHYVTWPVLFVCVTQTYSKKEIKWLLYFIIAICIVGDILTLVQLGINPDISRLMGGDNLGAEMTYYYKRGVGGYGYVFAVSFLNFGVIRFLRKVRQLWERVYLLSFLVLNCIFILYASYTTAIVVSIVLISAAMISDVKNRQRTVFWALLAVAIIGYWRMPITEFFYSVAERMNLPWVAKRFGQLLYAQESDDMMSLRRAVLYRRSWNSFVSHPFFGAGIGAAISGHAEILDAYARYGLVATMLVLFFENCKRLCYKILGQNNLAIFYLVFSVFICIDTCSSIQIPVTTFFVVPLIAFFELGDAEEDQGLHDVV